MAKSTLLRKKADTENFRDGDLAHIAEQNGVTRMFDWDTNIDDVISDMVSGDEEITLGISSNVNGSEAGILLPLVNNEKPVFLPLSLLDAVRIKARDVQKLQSDIDTAGHGVM